GHRLDDQRRTFAGHPAGLYPVHRGVADGRRHERGGRVTYLRSAATTTSVTVRPSEAAFALAASHNFSSTRTERGGVCVSFTSAHSLQQFHSLGLGQHARPLA